MSKWRGHPSVKGSSELVKMVLLCFSAIGITFTWGFEMTYCTPYLLNLGLSKSTTSLVWIAGPISGLIVQPIVGTIADQSTSKWGRRRPLMVVGSVITALHLFLLGFTKEIVGFFLPESEFSSRLTIWLAIYSIWVIDFAINASMSCSRSLVVDILPIHKQQAGAAWYSRLAAFGHLLSYGIGSVDLVTTLGTTFGGSQFKQLALISIFAVLATCAVTCWSVTEKRRCGDSDHLVHPPAPTSESEGNLLGALLVVDCEAFFLQAARLFRCWFPFNFYGTTWVGETYFRYDLTPEERKTRDPLSEIGRIGSSALVIYSLITFAGSFLLPLFVGSPDDSDFTHRPPRAIASFLNRIEAIKPDLLTAWILGHLGFSLSMSLAPFATSYKFATVLVASCGLPWAMTQWAPPTFLGIEVNRLSGESDTLPTTYQPVSGPHAASPHGALSPVHSQRPALSPLLPPGGDEASRNPSHTSSRSSASSSASAPPSSASGELSGIYFGILNIYTTIPQFLGAVMSGIVFSILEPKRAQTRWKATTRSLR
ncbi:unnamed protein product [Parascedosporium putredinis]|uniref:Sucrose transporter n=1 Tax=Parascedosporium putredinis TaxID=1442378 RepID=A0A9P1MBE6_9PEZI|nr:unnamed protein product [Parascedosporium putredinis]CAI7998534.1 unnamed protein product [Parascedosporium putredinis]